MAIIPDSVYTKLTSAKTDFKAAKYGEYVRDGLVDVDDAVAEALGAADDALSAAIDNQLKQVDDTLKKPGWGADAEETGSHINSIINTITGTVYARMLVFHPGYFATYAPDYEGNVPIDITTPTPSTDYVCAVMPCLEGDRFVLNVNGHTGVTHAYGFLDSNYLSIDRCPTAYATLRNEEVVAPENAAYIIINNRIVSSDVHLAYGDYCAYKKENNQLIDENSLNTILLDVLGSEEIDTDLEHEDGSYWDIQTETATKTNYESFSAFTPIEVTPGEIYKVIIYCALSTKQDPVVIVDSNYKILKTFRGERGTTNVFEDIVIPDDGAFLLLTTYTNHAAEVQCVKYEITDVPEMKNQLDAMAGLIGDLSGKTIAVLGDSISTNGNSGENKNAVEITIESADVGKTLSAYPTTNDVLAELSIGGHIFTSEEVGTEVSFTPQAADVGKVIGLPTNYNPNGLKVWWKYLIDTFGCSVIPVCWSGASVTSHEKDKDAYKTSYAWHDAQIRKCGIRTPGTMERTSPDVIIIYRGTNDFSHSPYTTLTENYFDGIDFSYPVTDYVDGSYGFKEGMVLTINKLRSTYPKAKIYLCTLNVFKRVNYAHFPTNNGINTLPEYNNAIREIANYMGCGIVEFDKDGITFENCYVEGYITDSADHPTHPSAKGHNVMGKKAISDLNS